MDSGAGVLWEIFCSWEWDNNTDSWDSSPGFDKTTRRCGGHVEELLELTTAPPEKGGDGGAVDLWSWKGLKSEYIAPLTHNLWGMLSNSVHKYYEHNRKRIKTHYEPNFLLLISIKLLLRLYMDQKWLKPHYSQLYHTICRACCHVTGGANSCYPPVCFWNKGNTF